MDKFFKQTSNGKGIISMGWTRFVPNAIMMAVPYIGAKLITRKFSRNDPICLYILDELEYPKISEGEGVYDDGGFVFHTSLRAYGYLYEAFKDVLVVAKFLNVLHTQKLINCFKILEHPHISSTFSPWFTRTNRRIFGGFGHYGSYGFHVLDSIRGIVAKTEKFKFIFNAQCNHLCYYEADQTNFKWGQIWLGARIFNYPDSYGFWYQELVSHYPGVISYNNITCEIKTPYDPNVDSTTVTTKTIMPTIGESIICSSLDMNVIGIRNHYKIISPSYKNEVIELTLVTEDGYHTYISVLPLDTTLNSTDPIIISLNLGKRNVTKTSELSGYVTNKNAFAFKDNNTFVQFANGTSTVMETTVKHPETGCVCVYKMSTEQIIDIHT